MSYYAQQSNQNQQEQLLKTAHYSFAQGNWDEAKILYEKATDFPLPPIHKSRILHNLGIISLKHKEIDRAISLIRQAISLRPQYMEAYFNLASILIKRNSAKDFSVAISALEKVLSINPHHVETLNNLGHVLEKTGQHEKALHCFEQACLLQPQNSLSHYNLGCSLQHLERVQEAIDHFKIAIAITPNYAEALCNLSNLESNQGNIQEARTYLLQSIELNPKYLGAYINLGNLEKSCKNYILAENYYRQALSLSPNSTSAWYNLANLLRELSRFTEAETAYRQTIAADSNFLPAYTNLAYVLMEQSQPLKALDAYNQSLQSFSDPEVYGSRSQAILMSGDLATGFAEYEWRTKIEARRLIYYWSNKPRWNGEFFSNQRLLIYSEQGFGDFLQFIRYLPLVKNRGGVIILAVPKPMLRLSYQLADCDYVIEHTPESYNRLVFHKTVPLLSLPHIFGTTQASIPNSIPYIYPNKQLVDIWKKKLQTVKIASSTTKVGLVWAGNPHNLQGRKRTCGFTPLTLLAGIPNITFFSLQTGEAAKEAQTAPQEMHLIDFSSDLDDFATTAALISHLDLVISIDTAVAHLAGAMGKPVWLLLPKAAEWRWLLDRHDTPWYPSMQLFRQRQYGDWNALVQEVAKQLQSYVRQMAHK